MKNPCNLGIKQLSVVLRGCYLPIGVKMMNALGFLVLHREQQVVLFEFLMWLNSCAKGKCFCRNPSILLIKCIKLRYLQATKKFTLFGQSQKVYSPSIRKEGSLF